MPILFEEVYVCYEAFRQSRTPVLPEVRPYRDYVKWLKQQDMSEAEAYWRKALRGLERPASFSQKPSVANANREADIYDQQELHLSSDVSARVRAFVRQHQLTINTLVQGMWALLLSHHTRNTDIVFGATVSGRPPSLQRRRKDGWIVYQHAACSRAGPQRRDDARMAQSASGPTSRDEAI